MPLAAMAGDPNTMSAVGKAHRLLPSAAIRWTLPSWLPTTTQPSLLTAGDEVIGPRVS